jgi:hypothetical protein
MLKACGNLVHRLRMTQRTSQGQLSTEDVHRQSAHRLTHGKPRLIPQTLPTLSTDQSTSKKRILPLLITSYPHFPQPLLLEPQKKI